MWLFLKFLTCGIGFATRDGSFFGRKKGADCRGLGERGGQPWTLSFRPKGVRDLTRLKFLLAILTSLIPFLVLSSCWCLWGRGWVGRDAEERRRLQVWVNLLDNPESLTFGIDYSHLGNPYGIRKQHRANQEGCLVKLLRESRTMVSVIHSIAFCNAIQIWGPSLTSEERGQWEVSRGAPPHPLQNTDSERVTHRTQTFPPTSVSVVLLLSVIQALFKSRLPREALPYHPS